MNRRLLVLVGSGLLSLLCTRSVLAQASIASPQGAHTQAESRAPLSAVVKPQSGSAGNPAQALASQLVIGPGDLLETSIFGVDYACGTNKQSSDSPGCQVRVSDSGDITLPLIGLVKVAGLTVEQAEELVARRLVEGRFYKDPQVTIVQKEYSTQGVSVLGEVQKPGIYPLLGPHTLLEAISAAGGTTVKAGNDVLIQHSDNGNKPEHVQLNQPAASETLMRPGDTILVSKAGIVYVVGDVRQPSGVVMESSGLTVLQAMAMVQGPNSTANLDKSKLIRTTPQGGKQEIPIPVQKILSRKAEDVQLQPADILFIPTNAAKSAGRRGLEAILQTATGVAIYRP